MKRFLKITLLFTCLLLTFNLIVFVFAYKEYYAPYSVYKTGFRAYLFADSHGLPIFDYGEKSGVYNFSAGGDSYTDMYRKLSFLLSEKVEIETVYLSADDHTLSHYRDKANNTGRSIVYAGSDDFENSYNQLKNKYIRYYFPVFHAEVRSIFRSYLITRSKQILFRKAVKNDVPWQALTDADKRHLSQTRLKFQFPGTEKSEAQEKKLKQIIELCRQNHIKLIGVRFPLSKEFAEALGQKSYGAAAILEDAGIPVLDFKSLYINQPTYFLNQDHLNTDGGKHLSKLLFKDSAKLVLPENE